MKCPFCSEIENKVIDSRLSKDGSVIRRRRECLECSRRFTTYEHIEEIPIMIIKKDGRRELFNREKVRSGMLKACEKRNISMNIIEEFIDEMERDLRESEEKEIQASVIGEKIMAKLHELDDVAYVRFASVYREFKDVNDFVSELKKLLSTQKGPKDEPAPEPPQEASR
jgi:transcriptional repressor NrdR